MLKAIVVTYYWPPSGGSGVQRWLYFCKYLEKNGIKPIVVTVDEKHASYKFTDQNFVKKVEDIEVHKTKTLEVLKLYSRLTTGDPTKGIPQGFSNELNPSYFKKTLRFIRGNFVIPDARKGWRKFAIRECEKIIKNNDIDLIITTGPPHSTHKVGLKIKEKHNIKWVADFRDPWVEIYSNDQLYRTPLAIKIDSKSEKEVLENADFITTIGPGMVKHLIKREPICKTKIDYIFNGFDSELVNSLKPNKDNSCITITHIGLFSRNKQPVQPLYEVLRKLYSENKIVKPLKIKLIGNVSQETSDEFIKELPFAEIIKINYIPHSEAVQHMLDADLLLNSMIVPDTELMISGKLMEYISSKNPILCLGNENGDAANLLNNFYSTKVISRNNINAIYSFLEKFFSGSFDSNDIKDIDKYSRISSTKKMAKILKMVFSN